MTYATVSTNTFEIKFYGRTQPGTQMCMVSPSPRPPSHHEVSGVTSFSPREQTTLTEAKWLSEIHLEIHRVRARGLSTQHHYLE